MSTPSSLLSSDRAEDLTGDQALQLFAGASGDNGIVAKLMSPGAHLLQGSRGAGKTMLLRVALERTKREAPHVLPVFVSFSRYLSTYNTAAKSDVGYSPFQSWVLAKILAGMRDQLRHMRPGKHSEEIFGQIPLDDYTRHLESHYQDIGVSDPVQSAKRLGVDVRVVKSFAQLDQIQSRVLRVIDAFGFQSVALFLDEAAQSFAEELQPEFFSLVRHLRHSRIWVKAATYPHTTNFGRDFDVGHDAIVLPVERQIETSEGMQLFFELVQKRFGGTALGTALSKSESQTRLLIKASGGTPRWFIHLLNALDHNTDSSIDSHVALSVIKQLPDGTLWPYLNNLRSRLRSRSRYIDAAVQLVHVFLDGLRESNKAARRDQSTPATVYVAISTHKTVPFRVHAALELLQYAGIIASRGPRKISERDTAEMFLIHPAILVKENVLFSESNPPIESSVLALTDPHRERFREYTRNSPRLQGFRADEEEREGLACTNCQSELPDGARFCSRCGAPVVQKSPFAELLARPSTELELTPGIRRRLLEDGRFATVGSVVNATDQDLDNIKYIGTDRVRLIRYAAEEFLAG